MTEITLKIGNEMLIKTFFLIALKHIIVKNLGPEKPRLITSGFQILDRNKKAWSPDGGF